MTPAPRLVAHLDALLEAGGWPDYGPNGLQVPGREEVATVVTGVSATRALLEAAAAEDADLVVVHHGLFWSGEPLGIDRVRHARLKLLFDADMGLAAYHLPLDGHLEHGNNALLAGALGAASWTPAFPHRGRPIGVVATLPDLPAATLLERVRDVAQREDVLAFLDGPEVVRTLGIVSGAGADALPEAIALGCDAFLTGEPAERNMAQAREYGIHFLAAGHHATERLGVQRLGALLAAEFGVRHVFVDVPNPI